MTIFNYVVLIIYLIGVISGATYCPNGWMVYEDSCYLFSFDLRLNYTEAQHHCQQRDGHLVEIGDVHENNFILHFIKHMQAHSWWIGLNDEDIESEWIWPSTHTTPTFTYWDHGQPDSAGGNQDCVVYLSPNYMWHDGDCSTYKAQPICELSSERPVVIGKK